MKARRLVSTLVLATSLAIAAPARAAGVDPAAATAVQREQAQTHFLKGKALFDKNDFAGALEEFRASLALVASPNARLYVARALRELNNLVEAYVEFGRTAADAKEHERDDGRYGKAAEAALAERDAIAPKIGFVMLTVHNSNETTTINVGGNAILRAGWADPVPVKPGTVEVEAVTPGLLPVRKSITVAAGQKMPVDLDAQAPAVAVTTKPTDGNDTSATRASKRWMLPAAIVGGGVGLVGLLTFTFAGIASNNTYSDLKTKCGSGPCPASLASEVGGGKSQAAAANVGLIVGMIGVAAGATFFVLYLLPPKANSASAALLLGPSSLGLRTTF